MAASSPQDLARVARALGDATRLDMLRLVVSRGEISCQELTREVGLAQATVSHHLKVLSQAGLVSARKEGPFHWYRASAQALADHAAAIARLAPRTSRKPAGLRGIDRGKR
ncbi:MAG TPA: metalloregulator ArsR/SmtB family transcription factor [Anaeromyxobacter sp.]|nr:metalloregulator ArsR/SmtB family transcription factor [Anaeromyxobacter sp.]